MTPKPCFLTLASVLHSRTCAPNLARRFAVKHPPYPTNPTTARALDRVRIEQARQILARLSSEQNAPKPTKPTKTKVAPANLASRRPRFLNAPCAAENTPKPTKPTSASYTFPVTSKKGVIGIGVPMHRCDASRSLYRRAPAACSFVPPVFGGSGREPQGSPVRASGARYANLFELPPPIGVGCGGFCKPHRLEAIHG